MSRFPAERLDPAHYWHRVSYPVFFGDLDVNRHINNVAIGRYLEQARVDGIRRGGLYPAGLTPRSFVAKVCVDYLAEGHWDHDVLVGSSIAALGTKSLTFHQGAWQEGRPIALAEVVVVHVDGEGTPAAYPDDFRAAVGAMLAR